MLRSAEAYSFDLTTAGESVVLAIGAALARLWQRLVRDPDDIARARRAYDAALTGAVVTWNRDWRSWADDGLAGAYLSGVGHADAQLNKMSIPRVVGKVSADQPMTINLSGMSLPPPSLPDRIKKMFQRYPDHTTFYGVFRRAAYHNLEGTAVQILRTGQDLYRQAAITAGQATYKEADIFTRRALSQKMLDDFASQGVQSVVYRDGKRVSIDAYAEMVGRTMSHHSAVQAGLNRYEQYGYDLVRVSAHFRACPLCVPWEGRILSQGGKDKKYPPLAVAIEAGLFHPNCLHSVDPYFPGISPEQQVRLDPAEQQLVDKYGYDEAQRIAYSAQERQREIERNIRYWKRREMVALDSQATTKAHQKVRDWQATQRAHLRENTFLPRKYERESITRAH